MSEKKLVLEDIVERTESFAKSQDMNLGSNTRDVVNKLVHEVVAEESKPINVDFKVNDSDVTRAIRSRSRTPSVVGSGPGLSIPIKEFETTVEVAPGILVSQHLIRDAVAATSDVSDVDRDLAREKARKRMFDELREDINTSKQVVQSLIERMRTPVNEQEKYISYDAMPAGLQRVVKAYIDASAANRELDEAIKALSAEPRSSVV